MSSNAPPRRVEPGPGQESVWDYPRPPAIVPAARHIRVVHRGITIADTWRAMRVLETSQPPAFYINPSDIAMDHIAPAERTTFCEWKGNASYWSIIVEDETVPNAAWSYERPTLAFESIRGYLAFYARLVDECWVDDERVHANPGSFYGGWITSEIVGPFKGDPGTEGW